MYAMEAKLCVPSHIWMFFPQGAVVTHALLPFGIADGELWSWTQVRGRYKARLAGREDAGNSSLFCYFHFFIFSLYTVASWHLMVLCWSGGDGIDSPCAKFKSALIGLSSTTLLDRCKIEVLLPHSCFLTSAASTSHICSCTNWVCSYHWYQAFSLLLCPRQNQVTLYNRLYPMWITQTES